MFLYPLRLTHKNGFLEQFDVPQIFGAFIMIFFNLSPFLETQEIAFFKKKKMNQTESLEVGTDGSDTWVQGAKHFRERHVSLSNTEDRVLKTPAAALLAINPSDGRCPFFCPSILRSWLPCVLEFRVPSPASEIHAHG